MVKFAPIVLLSMIAATASGAPVPLRKRIQQTIADSLTLWEQACNAAGGGQQCNPLKIASFDTLLAAAAPCDQQDQADKMIDLAHQLKSNAKMIQLTQIFMQQPRNSPNSVGMPYCDTAPKNSELLGYFQCQFQGSNLATFSNGAKAGGANTLPFQHTALNPPGSCPAHPQGPIPDGQQLVDITQNPGPPSTGKTTPGSLIVTSPSPVRFDATSDTSNGSSNGDFHLQNGQDAQKLNAKFAGLTPESTCTAGENACIGGKFAQCVGTSFVSTPCGAGTECFALPLVNKPGTSVTCTTQSDAVTRIAATGATGGLTGSG
ncbi:proline-rich protein [Amanita rubescens]|nr:proline-rich protein [Amanita rubescens]